MHPRTISDLKFDETVLILSNLSDEKTSELRKSLNCLSLTRKSGENRMTYTRRISSAFELSDFSAISKDHFKCLLFLSVLRELFQNDVRYRILRMNQKG